jgi:hypothetical protein
LPPSLPKAVITLMCCITYDYSRDKNVARKELIVEYSELSGFITPSYPVCFSHLIWSCG